MQNKIDFKPTAVLAVITTVTAALLIIASINLKPDENTLSEQILEKCVSLMGEGDFSVVSDWKEAGYKTDKPDGIQRLIVKDDGVVAFQLSADGYAKDGLNMLVAMNFDGSVKGIAIISMSETPGLGTKVNDDSFLSNFIGIRESVSITKSSPKNSSEVQALTGATYSSKGVAKGISLAVNTFREMGVKTQ